MKQIFTLILTAYQLAPIYTNNPKDPRLVLYQDSVKKYKETLFATKTLLKVIDTAKYIESVQKYRKKLGFHGVGGLTQKQKDSVKWIELVHDHLLKDSNGEMVYYSWMVPQNLPPKQTIIYRPDPVPVPITTSVRKKLKTPSKRSIAPIIVYPEIPKKDGTILVQWWKNNGLDSSKYFYKQ